MRISIIFLLSAAAHSSSSSVLAFTTGWVSSTSSRRAPSFLSASTAPTTETSGFIATELRGAAMKLHTTRQAPKEGTVKEVETKKYVTTHEDYLHFLVDSQFVYETLEEIVNSKDELAQFRNTGMERSTGLEQDIEFMMKEYNLEKPAVGDFGKAYVKELKSIESIPELMCHYYNYYFAHTAGGRMIGKQMAALLLEKKTLEFYKWDGDLNAIKETVKGDIEEMAAKWSREEKDECVSGTAAAFRYGGGINAYLGGRRSPE